VIISHRYKFIFVKTLKTAGSSIEVMLEGKCSDGDVVTRIHPPVPGHKSRNDRGFFNPIAGVANWYDFKKSSREVLRREKFYNHIPARFARARLPRSIWNSYFKFCVDRNPWDKSLSHFNMFKNADWHVRYDPDLTLEKYLANGIFCHNTPFYCDLDGTVLVDKILRYDELGTQLPEVMKQLGIEFEQLPHAKGNLRADKAHYSEVISGPQARVIGKAFEKEIKLMGWNF